MPPAPRHKNAIMEAALKLFRRNGYAATGMNDIVEASGAPKGSVYHYFPEGKASIAVAAVELAGARAVATLSKLADNPEGSGAMLKDYARQLGVWLEKSAFRDGCPITTVVLELSPQHREVTMAARQAFAARRQLLVDTLVREGWKAADAERMALLSISAIQGALVQARLERSSRPLTTVAELLSKFIGGARD